MKRPVWSFPDLIFHVILVCHRGYLQFQDLVLDSPVPRFKLCSAFRYTAVAATPPSAADPHRLTLAQPLTSLPGISSRNLYASFPFLSSLFSRPALTWIPEEGRNLETSSERWISSHGHSFEALFSERSAYGTARTRLSLLEQSLFPSLA